MDVSEVSNFDVYSERSVPVIDNIPNVSDVQNDVPAEPVCELNHSTNFVNTSENMHNNQFPLHSEWTQHGLVTSFQKLSVKPKQRRFDAVEIPNVTCMPFSQPDEHFSADKHFHASLPNISAPISNAYSVSNNSAPNIIPCSSYLVTCSAASSNYVGSMSYHNQVPFQNTAPSFSQHVPPFIPKMSVIPPKSNHDANMYKCPFKSTSSNVFVNPPLSQPTATGSRMYSCAQPNYSFVPHYSMVGSNPHHSATDLNSYLLTHEMTKNVVTPFDGTSFKFCSWIEQIQTRIKNLPLSPLEILHILQSNCIGVPNKMIQVYISSSGFVDDSVLQEVWSALIDR